MIKMKIVFKNMEDINKFVHIVRAYNYDMDLERGKFVVDAKSLLGIINLGLCTQITLTVHAESCEDLTTEIEQYIAA